MSLVIYRDCIESVDSLDSMVILIILILSIQEHGVSFHFFELASVSLINVL